MNKLILPINAYIVNSNGSIVDAFSGIPSYGNENGADVYHVYNADENAYYNVLMTEELKAVIANTFNAPYMEGSDTGGSVRVLTVDAIDPKEFAWVPISSIVVKDTIRLNGVDMQARNDIISLYAEEPNFLYVTAPADGGAAYISFKRQGTAYGGIYYAQSPYSTDWTYLNYDTSLYVTGKKYYLRGNVNSSSPGSTKYQYIATSGANTISFYGDITYLIGNDGYSNFPYTGGDKEVTSNKFYNFFQNCQQIVKAPDLPSTKLASYCYYGMFSGCTSLVNAPELPAMTLPIRCYSNMFSGCTSLVKAPDLPAMTLSSYCYSYMFSNCTSLTKAPELPAMTLDSDCYSYMFSNCTSLTKAPELPATALVTECYRNMFYNCTNLTKAPELPATTLASYCYYSMFSNCTNLTKAPELPATTLISYCYHNMFYFCNKLNYVKALFTTTPSNSYTANWLYGVASTGTFVKNKNATWTTVGTNAVPTGWTVYKTEQLHTDELPESYMEDTGKVLMVDASGLWVKKELNVDSMTNVTYSDIKTLRDTSALTPGMLYRITDYECTTSVADTSVAGHAFDIVVVADSSDILNENARAIQNADDDYFDSANLQAWELKYTIDNNDIYAWATQDGKGVVYYMEDEYGNVCGYDFKNIKFAFADTSSALVDSSDHYYYTFTDASTDGDLSMKKDSSTVCEKNRIMALNDDVSFILPFTVFIAGNSVYNNTILDASDNIFCEAHDNEIDRTIGNVVDGGFNFNEVGTMLNNWFTGASEANSMKYISNSKFGGNFAFNTIRYCTGITAGSSFMLNEVGEYFNNSSFGNNCYDNFFGPYCGSITAGNDFRQNTLEMQCNNITFGNNCTFNRMGTVSYSRIGNNCSNNQIDGGKYIYFGNASNQGGDWIVGNRFIGITQYVYFYNTGSASQSNTLRKYHLFNICGTSGSYKHVSDVTRNNSSEIFVLTRPDYSTPDANSLIYVNPAVLPEKTKGGTAGQILVKISGTDYDMGWRTVDVGSQIAYDSSNKTISLKDASGNVLGTPIDAADFIKDGMVSDVSVYDSNLVISFNTDAGKEDISIPLSRIFDSSNYYTKSEINDMFDDLDTSLSETFGSISDVIEENELVTAAALNELDTSIGDLKNNLELAFDYLYDDLSEMQSTVSGLETASPWIYGTGENSAVLRNSNTTTANGINSISHGYDITAFGNYSHAEGSGSHSSSLYLATGDANATTYTVTAKSTGGPQIGAIALYGSTYATVTSVDTIGSYGPYVTYYIYSVTLDKTLSTTALTDTSIYISLMHIAYGNASHTEGGGTHAIGAYSHAEGGATYAISSYSHAEGYNTLAKNQYSHAEGMYSHTFGQYSHAEGYNTIANGTAAHAEGWGRVAGRSTSTKPSWTISGNANATTYTTSANHNLKVGDIVEYDSTPFMGYNTIRIAKVKAIPSATTFTVDITLNKDVALTNEKINITTSAAYSNYSHVEGQFTITTGVAAHAEGYSSRADGSCAHAEGYYTIADGSCAHAEGYYTTTHYQASHAEGDHTVTDSSYSHAEGSYTLTTNHYEHAQGRYNKSHKVNTTFGNAGNTLNSIGIGVSDASRLNAVEVMQNGDIYITGVGSYDGSNYIDASTLQEVINNGSGGVTDFMTNVTYVELRALRDSSSLVPGMQYRITDYECTTTQIDTLVAGHVFDIIVIADSSTVLNENARATWHNGDTYFQNCKLDKWQIMYTIDNDDSLYSWADTNAGKGVIYYMKDEYCNECQYDFKNILFKRWEVTDASLTSFIVGHEDNPAGLYYGLKDGYEDGEYYEQSPHNAVFSSNTGYFYTFDLKDVSSGISYDMTVKSSDGLYEVCLSNSITGAAFGMNGIGYVLPNVIFLNSYPDIASQDMPDEIPVCTCNHIENSTSATFGDSCSNNIIKDAFFNTLGSYCSSNILTAASNNIYGNYCGENISDGNYITLEKLAVGNKIGIGCSNIEIGENSRSNLMYTDSYNISIGANSNANIFYGYNYAIKIGNYSGGNLFHSAVSNITFGTSGTVKDHYNYITIEQGNMGINLNCIATLDATDYYRNIKILQGTHMTNNPFKTINDSNKNQTYQTVYQPVNSLVISV